MVQIRGCLISLFFVITNKSRTPSLNRFGGAERGGIFDIQYVTKPPVGGGGGKNQLLRQSLSISILCSLYGNNRMKPRMVPGAQSVVEVSRAYS
jgi:hypothetical protein